MELPVLPLELVAEFGAGHLWSNSVENANNALQASEGHILILT
jgi:hypothetical protein